MLCYSATAKALFGLPEFLTKRDAWAASLLELLTLDQPRTDCPMTLPAPPTGIALPDSPTLLPDEHSSEQQLESKFLPGLQCKQYSKAGRADDGECSRIDPTRRQLKLMEQFSRLSQVQPPPLFEVQSIRGSCTAKDDVGSAPQCQQATTI